MTDQELVAEARRSLAALRPLTNEEALAMARHKLAELMRRGTYMDRLAYTALVEKLEAKVRR